MSGEVDDTKRDASQWVGGWTVLITAYLLIHVKFEIDFWGGRVDPMDKFSRMAPEMPGLDVVQRAYLAKSTWFLVTILLVAFRVPFPVALGLGCVVYGTELTFFFGPGWLGWGSILMGIAVVAEGIVRGKSMRSRNDS